MDKDKIKKLSTESYKGVRDFYPEDMAIQNKIFDIWRSISKKYGYQEYNASVLEPAELYKAKSGDEIVNEQTYTFIDRGKREVTLRPEMTPTVARMVAQRKRELIFPLRWFSIPNLFRYEQPQRGRLREHWQLNVDIFGVESLQAENEILQMAYDITCAYGLKTTDFEIRINNRKLMNYVTKEVFALDDEKAKKLSKLIDKRNKLPKETFHLLAEEILNEKSQQFLTLINSQNFEEFTSHLPQTKDEHIGLKEIKEVIEALEKLGITNLRFDQTLMRGFDYYTGIVFEVFDKNPANRRSIFGGGRYDDLLSLFSGEKVPAFGFGAGDVIARDLLETYEKINKGDDKNYENNINSPADIYICLLNKETADYGQEVAQALRNKGRIESNKEKTEINKNKIRVAIDYSFRKIGDQIKNADKMHIPYIICIGEEEIKTGKLKLKSLETGEEKIYTIENLVI